MKTQTREVLEERSQHLDAIGLPLAYYRSIISNYGSTEKIEDVIMKLINLKSADFLMTQGLEAQDHLQIDSSVRSLYDYLPLLGRLARDYSIARDNITFYLEKLSAFVEEHSSLQRLYELSKKIAGEIQ